jgi:hypothetical protein
MISIALLILFLFGSYSLEPSDLVKCKSCKWFINNKNNLEEDGLCKLFSKIIMKNKKIVKVYNNAKNYCRKHEHMCGKKGKLHMDLEEENTKCRENNKNTEQITEQITEKITEQITKNNNDTIEEILNMSKESYDYYNFLTGKIDEDTTTPE